MKLSQLISNFAEFYVDAHEEQIAEAIFDAMDVDLDDVVSEVVEALDDMTEAVKEEVLNRM